jgi:hypothetical protein
MVCVSDPIPDCCPDGAFATGECCVQDSDCDDRDDCTADSCVDNHCVSDTIDGCCRVDDDCADDGDECTQDQCVATKCEYPRIPDCGVSGEEDPDTDTDPVTPSDDDENGGCAIVAGGEPTTGHWSVIGLALLALVGVRRTRSGARGRRRRPIA